LVAPPKTQPVMQMKVNSTATLISFISLASHFLRGRFLIPLLPLVHVGKTGEKLGKNWGQANNSTGKK
jgi:hypothetical protein